MLTIYKKLYGLLDGTERRRGALVLLLLCFVGLAESAGVASVMPFISVLANPKVVESNRYMAAMYEWLGLPSRHAFLLLLGAAVLAVLIGSLLLKALGIWAQLRFAQHRSHNWVCQLAEGYLAQPYEWFLSRHSAELGASVLAEVNQVVAGELTPGLNAAASTFVAAWLFLLLLAVEPLLALTATLVMGGLYGAVSLSSRTVLRRVGVRWRSAVRARFRLLQEMLGGIKEVKVLGVEAVYLARFANHDRDFVEANISSGIVEQLPSLAMQGILFGGVLSALMYLIASRGNFSRALPTLTLFAFAGYRLMPALQTIYQSLSQMRFSEPSLDSLCRDMASFSEAPTERQPASDSLSERLAVTHAVELQNVRYTYPNTDQPVLHDLTLPIPARATVGLVGSTGSGKTTVVDVLLGLLRPQAGALLVDGHRLTDTMIGQWHRSVGYVPQDIFLADDTVEANIAFGVPLSAIDRAAVERASRAAHLHDFVMAELPAGYQTAVGERGVRLSGGQRQRIGIARALYRDPELLILDEATSALDNLTEHAVMDAVQTLEGAKTIVIVAHRLSTVRGCDCIYMLEHGSVIASGSYEQLITESPSFRALAELA